MRNDVIIVTGGAGFIGSAVVRLLIRKTRAEVINIDKLTYAANVANVADVTDNPRYRFEHADICDLAAMQRLFQKHRPTAVMHLAAESHVDRSIDVPLPFVETNVLGTAALLHAASQYWRKLPKQEQSRFRFHHISTDEVFGSLGPTGLFTETTPYQPNSPYAASKASADHLVRAWHMTYGLPTVISNCSNNYGPYQFPEKLIPLMILNGLEGKALPVYGKGENIRDWLFVEDHARALVLILKEAPIGSSFNVGGENEARNIDLVYTICDLLDETAPPLPVKKSRRDLITFVNDRPGHDMRYAIDPRKIQEELRWRPTETLKSGLRRTIEWYLHNEAWWRPLQSVAGQRLGLSG